MRLLLAMPMKTQLPEELSKLKSLCVVFNSFHDTNHQVVSLWGKEMSALIM